MYKRQEGAARRANDANSYRDYAAGSATAEYRQMVDQAAAIAQRQKERVDPMYHEKIDALLDTYARKLAENLNDHYAIEARVPSILVAGGSNFPVRKKEKQNAARDRNMQEWQDVQGILDKIRSTGMGGISMDDPQAAAKLEALSLIHISPGKEKQLAVLKELLHRSDVSEVVNGCDAGREGELIFRFVYEQAGCTKPFSRLWISSMEDSSIREGFAERRAGTEYDALYQSALCRARADWLVGINATRLFSVLYHKTLNVGRVLSPTLNLLVERDGKITMFHKEKYHIVHIGCGGVDAESERISDAAAADALKTACEASQAVCVSLKKEKKTALPPKLFDLTSLQREANRVYGFTAKQTLDYAQSLYEKRFLTYPRTDSNYLTEDMAQTATDLAAALLPVLPFMQGAELMPEIGRVINSAKVSDHHAIIPTTAFAGNGFDGLPESEKKLMSLVCCKLLCAVAAPQEYETVTAVFDCGGKPFTAKGKTILMAGWKDIDARFRAVLKAKPDEDSAEDAALPELAEGQIFEAVTASVSEHYTTPPKPYTEDSLLSAMENAGKEDMPEDAERQGLGTPATRAAMIEKLLSAGFVERKGKSLVPTKDGINLAVILPDMLKSPLLTAEWETRLTEIAKGSDDPQSFMPVSYTHLV